MMFVHVNQLRLWCTELTIVAIFKRRTFAALESLSTSIQKEYWRIKYRVYRACHLTFDVVNSLPITIRIWDERKSDISNNEK